jgi:phosphoribosylformylglycinamidine cyclo-ligase
MLNQASKDDTGDYEKREQKAIRNGRRALSRAPWLFNRTSAPSKGFFFELKENDVVHPGFYAVHCVDGVGTKLFLSAWSNNYSLSPVDAVAMSANDMATAIEALPDTVDLYFAVQHGIEEHHMEEIMDGFAGALERIRIPGAPFEPNIGKIETASHDEMVALGVPGKGWDVGVVMTGYIPKHKVPHLEPKPGHLIVGVSSSGAHSNGYTSARHVLFGPDVEYREEWKSQYRGGFRFEDRPAVLEGLTVLEALQIPTAIYLRDAAAIGKELDLRDIYGVNITGGGLANFNRVGQEVSFEIVDPLDPLPIHKLLVAESRWGPRKAYSKQNMGMGFAYIVPALEVAEVVVRIIADRGENTAKIVGEVREHTGSQPCTVLHKPFEGPPLKFVGY